jgi:dihydroorotase
MTTTPTAHWFDTAVTGGRVLDAETGQLVPATVGIRDGRIAAVLPAGEPADAVSTVDAHGLIVTPGLIDLHTHVFSDSTYLAVDADRIGVQQGVTTIVDAGSAGALSYDEFRDRVVDASATRVLSFINVSELGLTAGPTELVRMEDVGSPALHALLSAEAHRGIRGIKARMSASVVGANGIRPLVVARRLAAEFDLPVMVHVGNEPPAYSDVIDLLVAGDVVSHAFHGKRGGLFGDGDTVSDAARRARDRGVLFDVGHGSASFSFETIERALDQGFAPDLASTDLHSQNVDGPVFSLTTTLSKLLAVGLPLAEVIGYATANAAAVIGESVELGSLAVGSIADLSLLRRSDGPEQLTDSEGVTRTSQRILSAVGAIRAGVDQRMTEARS